jgi:hypothetical protein
MNPEEYLDRLIERREHGEQQLPVIDDEVAASLAAVETLARLQEMKVPAAFASHLELSIRACARSLAQQNGRTTPLARPRGYAGLSTHFMMRRAWAAVLGIAAVLVVACVGILTASAQSLPGDTLYGLKQAEYQFAVTFAGDSKGRASVQINQLHSTLVDLSTVVNDRRGDDAIRLALNVVAAKTNDSQGAVAALPAGAEREAAQHDLDTVLTEEDQTLRQLMDHVDWPIQLAFTQQLGALGDPIPTVTNAIVGAQSNGTLQIILTGTHFAPQAELIIDGRPAGTVSQITPLQLVAVISASAWSPDDHALGVRNPDGTAAQIVLDGSDNGQNQPGSNHSRPVTPQPGGDSNDGGE